MAQTAYLDYQSAKPVDPKVLEQIIPFFTEKFGNPASLHSIGDISTEALAKARKQVAEFVNCTPKEVIFTSTATESINQAITGYANRNKSRGKHIIISEIEHISIHNLAKSLVKNGFTVSKIPVDQYGTVRLDKLKKRIIDETILISVGSASNEIGTIQPIQAIGEIAHENNIAYHCDAVASESLIPIDLSKDPIDLLTISSNDIYGPKGAAALIVRKGTRISPLIIGGGQEHGLRSGSENMPAIVGMGIAAEITKDCMNQESLRLQKFRDQLINEILTQIPDSLLNGHPSQRLPNNAHFRFAGIEGESLLLALKDLQIQVSTGSACSSKTLEASHTLIATGLLHEEAHGSLELTLGRFTKQNEIDKVLEELPKVVAHLRDLSPLYPN